MPPRERTLHVFAELPAYAASVLEVVDQVPSGRVVTYGDVAAALGRGGPRQVGAAMARHGALTAWWRVVNAAGELPERLRGEAARRWRSEGTPTCATDPGKVALPQARAPRGSLVRPR